VISSEAFQSEGFVSGRDSAFKLSSDVRHSLNSSPPARESDNRRDPEGGPSLWRIKSLERRCFFSGRIGCLTRAEFRQSNSKGSRGFEFPPLRRRVCTISLRSRDGGKSPRDAGFCARGEPENAISLRIVRIPGVFSLSAEETVRFTARADFVDLSPR
jgi:hypothetical protein